MCQQGDSMFLVKGLVTFGRKFVTVRRGGGVEMGCDIIGRGFVTIGMGCGNDGRGLELLVGSRGVKARGKGVTSRSVS